RSLRLLFLLGDSAANLSEVLLDRLAILLGWGFIAALLQVVAKMRYEFVPIGELGALGDFFGSLWRGFFQRSSDGLLVGLFQLFWRTLVMLPHLIHCDLPHAATAALLTGPHPVVDDPQ